VSGFGRFLILAGVALVAIGLLVTWGPRVPFLAQLGRLPGDLRIERPGFRFYFPITTSILVSVVLTILLRLFVKK
jgi:hypothetical protein